MKPKHQRLLLAVVAVFALIGAGLIAAAALREEASYFYTPTTLASANVALIYATISAKCSDDGQPRTHLPSRAITRCRHLIFRLACAKTPTIRICGPHWVCN